MPKVPKRDFSCAPTYFIFEFRVGYGPVGGVGPDAVQLGPGHVSDVRGDALAPDDIVAQVLVLRLIHGRREASAFLYR